MSDARIRVKIDLAALIAHLSREEGRPVGEAEITRWLTDAGFTPAGAYWIVREADLGQLDPSEVLEVLPHDEHDA